MTRPRIRTLVVLLVAAAAAVLGVFALQGLRTAEAGSTTVSQTRTVLPAAERPAAPVLDGTTLTGEHLSTADWRGSVIVVNFWGSWCTPCRKEAPGLRRVADETSRQGVRFVGVDVRDTPVAGLGFEHDFGITYPSFNDPATKLSLRFGSLAPQATPSTYVFDRKGRIAAVFFGATTYDELYSAVELVVEKG
ncbi:MULTISPECIES: TlpA family protein disulfide reductase [Streptomyces]|uniref:TlpA family protein disulfide reductase n=1 Tax=Streptomyces TaxID=1883 RepID=UPI0018DEFA61|nr:MULTISPECIES: TlpA disulfide reductase family protein [Streptomyces]MCZ4102788.1 TlpA disulfide reductase family protein [Streptomyces sp. H39-C1]